ncbi:MULTISPECIES: response regulator [Streptomyces]|uniref:response regulator n=1 Tax=Streptomyces TaxID=1883 RepID=UPI000367446F|nr:MULTISPECIES: response regulator transcription factor [Streptomyces]MCW7989927.1 LuxR family transcriptional regulator [Streptomyces platensis subsp. clarensis]MCX5444950.1 response regulator transcription factor [Streptomyces libani]MYX07017.1 response regulator [Streptomyces sp. SID8375]WDT57249.1 response regulator transcription factor [Streptomyces sp. G7(2002)]
MTDVENPAAVRVLLADDHPVVREGLCAMLESDPGIEVVGQAGSGEEAVTLTERLAPDLVLLDLRMGAMDGVAATGHILRRSPRTKVVIVTTYEDDSDILRAVEAGASGYLLKGSSRAELIDAVHGAARGATVLTPSLAPKLFRARAVETPLLSARECEVLRLVSQGLTNAEIGRQLFIGEATVKTHLLRAFKKLEVSDRTAAVITALERGLLA